MRWIYQVTFAAGKSATVPSKERIYDCLGFFRRKFGEDAIAGVTERYGDGKPVASHLLPLCREERDSVVRAGRANLTHALDSTNQERCDK